MNANTFDILRDYQQEAAKIIQARKSSKILHDAGDIDASGDEIEQPVRDFLARKMPAQYSVCHGHIVDSTLTTSPQLDVLVVDTSATPVLFEGKNGTTCFPYESVYLYGEIKSTYYPSKKHIAAFAKTTERILTQLKRDPTPHSYLGNNLFLPASEKTSAATPYKNPLFTFMMFVDIGDATVDQLVKELQPLYLEMPDQYLPNIICFLNGVVVTKAEVSLEENNQRLIAIDADSQRIVTREDTYWTIFKFTHEEFNSAHALANLTVTIFSHLQRCLLLPPPIQEYVAHLFKPSPHDAILLDPRVFADMAAKEGKRLEETQRRKLEEKREQELRFFNSQNEIADRLREKSFVWRIV